MSFLSNFFSNRQKIPLHGLLDFTPLAPRQKEHLGRVYAFLLASIISTALGVQFSTYVFGLPVFLAFVIQLGCLFYIASTSAAFVGGVYHLKDSQAVKRLGAFATLTFTTGMMLAPYLRYARYVHPSIVPTAFLATLAVFVCFSLAAMFASERKFLYLGGILSSVMGYFSLVALFNIFFHSKLAHDVLLYGGLIAYMGFILYDTQIILYDINRGMTDPLVQSLAFYGDVVGIFIKVVQILVERENDRQDDRHRRH